MTRDDFNKLREQTIRDIFGINDTKGADYAGDEDALGNFKDAAEQLGVTPEQIWGVYAHKHWSAVMSFCKKGQVESEPIEGRIHDIMVYCLLLLGLIEDRRESDRIDALMAVSEQLADVHASLGDPVSDSAPEACRCGRATRTQCVEHGPCERYAGQPRQSPFDTQLDFGGSSHG